MCRRIAIGASAIATCRQQLAGDYHACADWNFSRPASFTRNPQFGDKSLRLARPLQPGWVVTIEPGIYINPLLTNRWKAEGRHAAFIDYAMFERHAAFGGIRIEDDVLITPQGARVLGPTIPKVRAEVEALAAS